MKKIILLMLLFAFMGSVAAQDMRVCLGNLSTGRLNQILKEAVKIAPPGDRIQYISDCFIDVPYQPGTMIGGSDTKEEFVLRLDSVDCFTFLDYVEALRRSSSYDTFVQSLKSVRYQSGKIDYLTRNHFFSDWRVFNAQYIADVTEMVGGSQTKAVIKNLNRKASGDYYLQGVQPRKRKIWYIPADNIDQTIINALKNGDYIGIYTNKAGLDVSHVGVFIRKGNSALFRHATSLKSKRKVIDSDFLEYIRNKPGIVILRAQ